MNSLVTPTKTNLIKAKNSLDLSKRGFELLDKKRNILIKEMMSLVERAKQIQKKITITFQEAYKALKVVNITVGINTVEEIAMSIPKEEEYEILSKSIMGVIIPDIRYLNTAFKSQYSLFRTNPTLDIAVIKFNHVMELIYELAEIENSVYKLAVEIRKTQRRANALEKVQIPKYEKQVHYIQNVLEEKEREDFFRLKRVKNIRKKNSS